MPPVLGNLMLLSQKLSTEQKHTFIFHLCGGLQFCYMQLSNNVSKSLTFTHWNWTELACVSRLPLSR